MSSSPSSIAHTQSHSSDEEFRTKSSLGISSLTSSTGFPGYASDPSPTQNNLFQDYSLTGLNSRESYRDGGTVHRSSPNMVPRGFGSASFSSGLATPNKDVEDNVTLSSVDSSDSRGLTKGFDHSPSASVGWLFAEPSKRDSWFGRLDKSRVSPSESRGTSSLSGSVDLAHESDQHRSSLHTLSGREFLPNSVNFGLTPSARPSLPSRPSSIAFDSFNGMNRTSSIASIATVEDPGPEIYRTPLTTLFIVHRSSSPN
ncbi:uncharacterized protein EI90DRAFT_3122562 [Cantharellus anzutake]|uniref:uncharacterized protein n=1 Tax=Cantharellus anzutake TaxID=1750568 RepID=UPI001906C151|nr:uncharacterized protein EI90DRAFT_3122562 [Cantharellus anzutake]KAF8332817.1 hypothetical protein EI90DRAFT_3122562 [Cantharellus anzutake]